jgi:outer membrane protein OmpA-like peptidoglycan-associated protein
MRKSSLLKIVAFAGACMLLGVLAGCAGLEFAPKRSLLYYHEELPAAERAVAAARAAGKDKQCPAEFQAAEKAKNEAYEIYWSCRTKEGIAKANEAAALAKALCPGKPVPAAVPPPAAAPATPPAPPVSKVVDRLTVRVNFDTDKAIIRKADIPELQKAVDFVKKYPGYNISVEGHTDNVGKDAYNQALSERRAAAVKAYLVERGAAHSDRIKPVGFGKTRPIADNKTAEGKFKNRRVEILVLSQ